MLDEMGLVACLSTFWFHQSVLLFAEWFTGRGWPLSEAALNSMITVSKNKLFEWRRQSRFAKTRPKELSDSASGSANNLVRDKNTDPRIWKQATAPSADVGATLGMRSNIVTVRDFFYCNRHNVFFKFSKKMKPSTIPVPCRASKTVLSIGYVRRLCWN